MKLSVRGESYRVFHIDTENTWRGGEKQVELLIRGLRKKGVECHLAAAPGGPLLKKMYDWVPVLPLRMNNDLDFVAVARAALYCRDWRIRLIDAHTTRGHALGFWLKLLFPETLLVVHRRVDFPPPSHWGNRVLYLSRRVDQFVAISNHVAAILEKFGVGESRIAVIHSAVDPSPFQFVDRSEARASLLRRLSVSSEVPLIGTAAHLAPHKDHATLFKALAILKKESVAFHCVIAGEGRLRRKLERMANDLEIARQLTFLGFHEDMPAFMRALDVFTLSSRTEGLGTAVLEAVHAGACVVATGAGGIPEMVTDGHSSLLCEPGNFQVLAQNLKRALENCELRERIAANARCGLQARFLPEIMVSKTLSLYENLLERS
ncbi:MAG: glycosyltransferase family 4 protein [Acidobacteria bacterium]|nr:glycosyltransferase family 4 protein [Acidobacteriota bacterium]